MNASKVLTYECKREQDNVAYLLKGLAEELTEMASQAGKGGAIRPWEIRGLLSRFADLHERVMIVHTKTEVLGVLVRYEPEVEP